MRLFFAPEGHTETSNLPSRAMDMSDEQQPEQVEKTAVDGNMKVADLTVNQLFNVLNACVDRAHRAAFDGAQQAIAAQQDKSKIITPNFTPKSANRYAKRHP